MTVVAIAALGILIQFASAPEMFSVAFGIPFPPGLIYIAGAVAIVWAGRRSAWSSMATIALSAWILVGGLLSDVLIDNLTSSNSALVAGTVVMGSGLLLSSVAGAAALLKNRHTTGESQPRPLSRRNPGRTSVIGLAGAERLDFNGPGPIPFFALAIAVTLVRGRYVVGLALVLSTVFLGAVFSNPGPLARLADTSDLLGFGSTLFHAGSLVVIIIAG